MRPLRAEGNSGGSISLDDLRDGCDGDGSSSPPCPHDTWELLAGLANDEAFLRLADAWGAMPESVRRAVVTLAVSSVERSVME